MGGLASTVNFLSGVRGAEPREFRLQMASPKELYVQKE